MAKSKKVEEASVVSEKEVKSDDSKQKKSTVKKVKTVKEPVKALFIQRFAALILDVMIVSMVASIISYPFLDMNSIQKLNDSGTQVAEDYLSGKLEADEYVSENISISYELAKKQGTLSLITIFLNILYFVVFQIKNNGQTLGKQLLRIKVKSTNGEELSMNQMIFRSMIINSILIDMVSFAILLFTNQLTYFYSVVILGMIQFIIIAASGIMVMFGKNRRGIHDLVAHTDVVRCDVVEEMEVCES